MGSCALHEIDVRSLLNMVRTDGIRGHNSPQHAASATSTFFKSLLLLMFEGSLEVKLPTIWRDEKAVSREKSQKRKDQKKEDAGARKGRKVAKHCVFSWFCGSGGLKSRLAKAAGAETSGEMRDEQLHAVVARSTFGSKMC